MRKQTLKQRLAIALLATLASMTCMLVFVLAPLMAA